MLTEPLPIEIFVATRFTEKTITNITENWRVEPEQLQKMIVSYFREMGIFAVLPSMEAELKETLMVWLQNSPDIYQLVKKAEMQEMVRRQSRRPE
ncbi:hypothetical protein [Oligoflexus tunisiensis]|uniref:hypothetical protein n=1 Tax=Oligoflexus tunisiensis TaxID=708132 RepID=UPI00114C9037|nr:hypothetical protein [Oligoflexus tunisiensis]